MVPQTRDASCQAKVCFCVCIYFWLQFFKKLLSKTACWTYANATSDVYTIYWLMNVVFCNFCRYDTTLSDACTALAKKWSSASDNDLSSFTAEDFKSLSSYQIKEFLAQLLEEVRHIQSVENISNVFRNELQRLEVPNTCTFAVVKCSHLNWTTWALCFAYLKVKRQLPVFVACLVSCQTREDGGIVQIELGAKLRDTFPLVTTEFEGEDWDCSAESCRIRYRTRAYEVCATHLQVRKLCHI